MLLEQKNQRRIINFYYACQSLCLIFISLPPHPSSRRICFVFFVDLFDEHSHRAFVRCCCSLAMIKHKNRININIEGACLQQIIIYSSFSFRLLSSLSIWFIILSLSLMFLIELGERKEPRSLFSSDRIRAPDLRQSFVYFSLRLCK